MTDDHPAPFWAVIAGAAFVLSLALSGEAQAWGSGGQRGRGEHHPARGSSCEGQQGRWQQCPCHLASKFSTVRPSAE